MNCTHPVGFNIFKEGYERGRLKSGSCGAQTLIPLVI
jgi:hypothetical protein